MTQATIEVTRRRPGFIGFVSTFLVFIDGVNAGVARRGTTARFHVTPGTHTVKVWRKGGSAASNLLTLTLVPGDVCSLGCDTDTASFDSATFGSLTTKVDQVRTLAKDGWVGNYIRLYEL